MSNLKFKYVDYLWDDAKQPKGDEVDLLIYRSNLLGADLRITNFGGGNTSCKTIEKDPITGEQTEVMWVKGSGGDIGTLTKKGLAGLYMEKLLALKNVYRGLEFEDEMVALFNHCIYDLDSKAPSIDTPLHAFIPEKHIDHLHPDSIIAIAASKNGKQITEELFEGKLAWVDWQRPGFDLALQIENAIDNNPGISGLILGGHGLFTWGETSKECYLNSLEMIEKASEYLEGKYGETRPIFGGERIKALESADRRQKAAEMAPILRGLCSENQLMVGHFTDNSEVMEFICSNDLNDLAKLGTSCPDHFLRTKISPLVLPITADANLNDREAFLPKMKEVFAEYNAMYADYYDNHKRENSPAMRDANPVVILWPGIGMFTFAKNKQTARVAAEFYVNAINVMKGSEAIGGYVALDKQEAFDIEYWLLEEAKLQRQPKEKPLSRKIAMITGSAGGIGYAVAEKLAAEGACVVISDIDKDRLNESLNNLASKYGKDNTFAVTMNVTDETDIKRAFGEIALAFGGMDILVNSAGLAISKPLPDTTEADWDLLNNVLVKGQFLTAKTFETIFTKQNLGGDIVNIASKNGLVSGPNNVAYGTAKAAQLHMSRLLAAELGKDHVRVNVVNPDAVISGSKIWEGKWAEGRAKAYGISVEDLPAHYAKRTLLNEIILPADIANAVFAFTGGDLAKSTGNILNVDGGVAAAFVR